MLRDKVIVLKEFVSSFKATGEIFPTSKWGSQALCRPLCGPRSAKLILEVGAGTGAVTKYILGSMVPEDRLTACELNPCFVRELQRKLGKDANYLRLKDRVDFFAGPVQELPEDRKYDVIVCSLPFLNFEAQLAQGIFSKLLAVSSPDAVMTYYEYIGLRDLSKAMPLRKLKQRLHELEHCFETHYVPRQIEIQREWRNVMPIKIFTLNMAA